MRAASRNGVSTSHATTTRAPRSDQPSASTAPSPPSVVAEPPTPTITVCAPSSSTCAISSPVPRVVARSGSFPPATSVSPLAMAISTTAVPSGSRLHSASTGSPSGPVTRAVRCSPPSASSVPSPPSASGSSRASIPAERRPRAIAAAASGAVSEPRNLSGQQSAGTTGNLRRRLRRMLLGLDSYTTDWLDLLGRWLHVVAAIAWIGTSFYYIALDYHLVPRPEGDDVGGEAWEIHGGGFYRVQKYRVAPAELPEPLHWFKWEAYTTWLSGFALLVVLYYFHADTYLIDRSVADLSSSEAIAISIGLLVAAWFVYDGLCRVLGSRPLVLASPLLALITLAAWGISHLFSGRATYLQIGAMLGTMMVGNVFFVIIPAHWELVRAKQAGREPDPAANARGKLRSVHNNYLTLPVVFTMLSNHFPFTYGHSYQWLILVVLLVIGAWIRHFFNLRHAGRTVWAIPASAAIAIAALAILIRPQDESSAGATPVSFARASQIVDQRCTACHSMHPTRVDEAPLGLTMDTAQQIQYLAPAIKGQAVDSTAMPLGNATGMTTEERQILGRWIPQGAKIR